MSDHLHAETWVEPGDTISVRLSEPANVMLLDEDAYEAYSSEKPFRYLGGWVSQDQITLWPPREGRWHVVIDLGGGPGRISASVQVMKA